jgi:hypothetical protein
MDSEKLKKFHQLTESFISEVEKRNINEGMSDTAKARWAGFKGGIKGLGNQIKGGVNKATGDVLSKGINYVAKGIGADTSKSTWAKNAQDLSAKGASQIHTGKNQAYTDKYNAYLKSTVDSIVNDLQSLNINVKDKNKLVTDLSKSISTNTQQPAKPATGAPAAKPAVQGQQLAKPVAPAAKPATGAPTAKPAVQGQQLAKPAAPTAKPAVRSQGISKSVAPAQSAPSTKPVTKGKQSAGQWLSPTQRVSMSGPQQGVMNISPDDPSQVENPHSPKYNKELADKRVSNAQKAYRNTAQEPEMEKEKSSKPIDLTPPAPVPNDSEKGKKNAREKVKAQMSKIPKNGK